MSRMSADLFWQQAGREADVYARIFDAATEALLAVDTDGVIRLWNPGAQRLFGHSSAAALGQPLDLIIPERFRPAHDAGFRNAVATGQLRVGGRVLTTRASHADGRKLYVDFSFGLLKDAQGQVFGVFAVGRESARPAA
jgi:PAS domain S-box-containing protein